MTIKSLLLTVGCLAIATSTFSQVSSVNAYYDSYQLHLFNKDPTKEKAIEVLKILRNYSSEDEPYVFDDVKLNDIYKSSVNFIFSVEKIVNYSWPDAAPIRLKALVEQYKAENKKAGEFSLWLEKIQLTSFDSIVHAIFSSLSSNPDFLRADLISNTQLTKSNLINSELKSRFNNYQYIVKALPDTIFYPANESATLQKLSPYREQIAKNIEDSINRTNKKVTRIITSIRQYFFDHLGGTDGKFLKDALGLTEVESSEFKRNDEFFSGINLSPNAAADSFYYKNETYSLTNFKLPTQTEVIDALAIYLAKRFKQEVALTLVDQFRKILKNEKLIFDLFPETYKMFQSGQVYEMPSFGSAWNYAISKDFSNLLLNLAKSPYVQQKIGDTLLVGHLQDVVKMCNLINKQYSYIDVVSQLNGDELKSNFFKQNIQTLYIINKELFDTARASRFWITADQLQSISTGRLNILFSLLRSKYRGKLGLLNNIDWNNENRLRQLQNALSSILVQLNNFQAQQRKLSQMPAELQSLQPSNYWQFLNSLFEALLVIKPEMSSPYIQRFITVTNYSIEIYSLLTERNYAGAALKIMDILPAIKDSNYVDFEGIVLSAKKLKKFDDEKSMIEVTKLKLQCENIGSLLKKYHFLSSLRNDVLSAGPDFNKIINDPRISYYKNVFLKTTTDPDRGALLLNLKNDTLLIRTKIDSLRADIVKSPFVTKNEGIFENDITSAIVRLTIYYKQQEVQNYISKRLFNEFDSFRKLTGFLSDVMLAGSSKNLSVVIEKYAMPPNSYKIKRASSSSWDLNAYVGAYFGRDFEQPYAISRGGWVWGLSAPIGVSYSWGTKKHKVEGLYFSSEKNRRVSGGNSNSFTLSVVDIGAVVSYRLSNSSQGEGLPQKVKWAQLLSPGLHYRWGIKDTPLCISTGVQYAPQLRVLEYKTNPVSAIRAYVGAFFDIPLFNIVHN